MGGGGGGEPPSDGEPGASRPRPGPSCCWRSRICWSDSGGGATGAGGASSGAADGTGEPGISSARYGILLLLLLLLLVVVVLLLLLPLPLPLLWLLEAGKKVSNCGKEGG